MFEGCQGSGTPLSKGGATSAISQITTTGRTALSLSLSLSGEMIARAAIQGILLASSVEALVHKRNSLEAQVAQQVGTEVPHSTGFRGGCASWQRHGEWII
jgi:hypothetical protein